MNTYMCSPELAMEVPVVPQAVVCVDAKSIEGHDLWGPSSVAIWLVMVERTHPQYSELGESLKVRTTPHLLKSMTIPKYDIVGLDMQGQLGFPRDPPGRLPARRKNSPAIARCRLAHAMLMSAGSSCAKSADTWNL